MLTDLKYPRRRQSQNQFSQFILIVIFVSNMRGDATMFGRYASCTILGYKGKANTLPFPFLSLTKKYRRFLAIKHRKVTSALVALFREAGARPGLSFSSGAPDILLHQLHIFFKLQIYSYESK